MTDKYTLTLWSEVFVSDVEKKSMRPFVSLETTTEVEEPTWFKAT